MKLYETITTMLDNLSSAKENYDLQFEQAKELALKLVNDSNFEKIVKIDYNVIMDILIDHLYSLMEYNH